MVAFSRVTRLIWQSIQQALHDGFPAWGQLPAAIAAAMAHQMELAHVLQQAKRHRRIVREGRGDAPLWLGIHVAAHLPPMLQMATGRRLHGLAREGAAFAPRRCDLVVIH